MHTRVCLVALAAGAFACGGGSSVAPSGNIGSPDAGGTPTGTPATDGGTATATPDAGSVSPPAIATHQLSATVSGSGKVVSSPPGIDCPGTCSASFDDGVNVMLTATAGAGAQFNGFSGACSGNSCTLMLEGDAAVTAIFAAIAVTTPPTPMHTVTISLEGSGSGKVVSTPPGIACPGTCTASFAAGSKVSLTATPGAGMTFTGFAGICGGQSCALVMSADWLVHATFAVAPPPGECANLLPASLPPPVIPNLACPHGCFSSFSDDVGGNFLLHLQISDTPGSDVYDFVSVRNGQASNLGSFSGTDEFATQVFSESSGFTELIFSPALVVRTFSPSGVPQGSMSFPQDDRVGIDPHPSGGYIALDWSASQDPVDFGFAVTTWQRFDKTGTAITGPMAVARTSVDDVFINSGVSLAGNTLLEFFSLGDGSEVLTSRQWVDANGTPLTAQFISTTSPTRHSYQFLLDGGLVERYLDTGIFGQVWKDGAMQASAAPAWLAARSSASWLVPIRQGKGYALAGTCAGIEVVAKSGTSCGCLPVPNLSAATSVGRDGSLIVPGTDHFELYPQLFQ